MDKSNWDRLVIKRKSEGLQNLFEFLRNGFSAGKMIEENKADGYGSQEITSKINFVFHDNGKHKKKA